MLCPTDENKETTMKTIDLSGSWQGRCILPEESFNYGATVPGSTIKDLINAGKLPKDVFYRDNAEAVLKYETADFEYEKSFSVVKEEGTRYTLSLEKLDTYATVYLNDEELGRCENAFIKHSFDITDKLLDGDNTVRVYFASPVLAVKGLENLAGAFTRERMHTRRIQCTYGWDWVGRFVSSGVRSVKIECEAESEILVDNAYIYTRSYDNESADVVVDIRFKEYSANGIVNISILSPNGSVAVARSRYCDESFVRLNLDVPKPKLWYPHGYGEQPLYTLLMTDKDGTVLHKEIFGIRIVKVCAVKDEEGSEYEKKSNEIRNKWYDKNEESSGFTLKINGKKILAMGANWVPCEPFLTEIPNEKITRALEVAKAGGVNMIRIWGGGDFESEHFYNECSRLGITVTQDFLMACGTYPEWKDSFIEHLRKEARYAAVSLRNKPCLVWWSGDNENAVRGTDTDEDYTGRRSAYRGIAKELYELDYNRVFLPSSPYGGNMYASNTVGTTHNTAYLGCLIIPYLLKGNAEDYKEFFHATRARFIAEEPQLGAISETSISRFMTREDIFGDDLYMWNYHTKNNPGLQTSVFDTMQIFAKSLLGEFKDGADRYFKYRYLQYEWVRVTLEQLRREAWFCSGMVYWMLNDCWPAASGWSIIDFYNLPKDAYYAFKRCSGKLVISFDKTDDGKISLYASAKGDEICGASVTVYKLKGAKAEKIHEGVCDTIPDGSRIVYTYAEELADGEVLIADIKSCDASDRTFYKNGSLKIKPAAATLKVNKKERTVTVSSDEYIHAIELTADAIFSDNCFSLLPGEERTVSFAENSETDIKLTAYTLEF